MKSEACLDAAEHDGIQFEEFRFGAIIRLGGVFVVIREHSPASGNARRRKCATEEMSVVCLSLSEKARKYSVVCFRETIEWE